MRLGSLLGQAKALLSRPLERATARSMRPLIGQLEATLARQVDQIEARQHQLSAPVISRLGGIESDVGASRRAVEALAEQQRTAEEGLGCRLERLEGQASRQEQAIQALADQQRTGEEELGRKLERLEHQASREQQAIEAIAEQQRQLSASVDERIEQAYRRVSTLVDERSQNLSALSEQQNSHIAGREASVANSQDRFNHLAQQVASLNETIERLPTLQTLKGLGIEDHLLESYGSVPPLHPVGDWRIGVGIDNPTNLLKDRIRKWNEFMQPVLLVWHADLKIMLWPGNENSRQLFVTGDFEPSEMSWVAANLKDNMVFIDVGANMGIYTMFGAKLVGPGGRVLAIEPSEREFQRLSFHVAFNNLSNVTCVRLAAADEVGMAQLKVASEEKSGQNTLGEFVTESIEMLRVETVRISPLDRVIDQHKLERVDVIKIDAEGAELRVLRGLAGSLERWRPKLLIELAPGALAGQNTSAEELVEWLRNSRYELFEFSRSTGELEEFQSTSVQYGSKNFVAIPAP
jgi:FkbM family methyltransferase